MHNKANGKGFHFEGKDLKNDIYGTNSTHAFPPII